MSWIKKWIFLSEEAPKQANTVSSVGKVNATVLGDKHGILCAWYRLNEFGKKKPAHTSSLVMAKFRYEFLIYPIFQIWLVTFWLFPNLRQWLAGKRFSSNNGVISGRNAYFEAFDKSY